jgi:hypothetical protein
LLYYVERLTLWGLLRVGGGALQVFKPSAALFTPLFWSADTGRYRKKKKKDGETRTLSPPSGSVSMGKPE